MFDGLISIFWQLVYEICTILCWLMQCIYETFVLFAGVRSVEYQGDDTFLQFSHFYVVRWNGRNWYRIVFCFLYGCSNPQDV